MIVTIIVKPYTIQQVAHLDLIPSACRYDLLHGLLIVLFLANSDCYKGQTPKAFFAVGIHSAVSCCLLYSGLYFMIALYFASFA